MEALLREKLPSHWSYAVTRDGRVFFVNDEQETTTWIHPFWDKVVQSGHIKHPDYQERVEYDITDEGSQYFIDHRSLSTSWLPPPEPVELRKKSKRSTSPFKRINSKRKSLKKKPIDVKRNRNSEVVQKGWLNRQEGSIGPLKTWKKRWCVLSDLCLFIYKGPEEQDLIGSVLLPSYKITPGQKDSANKKFIFKAEHENVKSEYFAGETVEEAENWMEAMHLASMAVSGNCPGSDDKTREHERMPNSRSANNIQSSHVNVPLSNSQRLDNRPPREALHKVDYKHTPTAYQPTKFTSEEDNMKVKDLGQMENQRIHEELNFVPSSSRNNINDMNRSGLSLLNSQWNHFDAPVTAETLEGNNFTRIKEWTEEQSKYRIDLTTPRSFEDVPYASTPVKELSPEFEKWSKSPVSARVQDLSPASKFPEHIYQSPNLVEHHKITPTQSDLVSSKMGSRQFSISNSEEHQKISDAVKPKESSKSSVASNASHLAKSAFASSPTGDIYSRPFNMPAVDVFTSPELFGKGNVADIVTQSKLHLKVAHNLLDVFSQSSHNTPVNREQLVQMLIQLRRDQTHFHEHLYCFAAEEDLETNTQINTIKSLLEENSLVVNHLENCLYAATTTNKPTEEIMKNDEASGPNAVITEPPKPRKRSTTQASNHVDGSPIDSTGIIERNMGPVTDRIGENYYAENREDRRAQGRRKENVPDSHWDTFNNGQRASDPSMAQGTDELIQQQLKDVKDRHQQMVKRRKSPDLHNSDEDELTFLETDLDSMQTINIASFSYGVSLNDLSRSSVFTKPRFSPKPESGLFQINNNFRDLHQSDPSPGIDRNTPIDQSKTVNVLQNAYKDVPLDSVQKSSTRAEFRSNNQHKQSVVPLKSSPDRNPSSYFHRRHRKDESFGYKDDRTQQMDSNLFSEVRQRTNSFSNQDADEFQNNKLRSIKSTHNLTNDVEEEELEESHAGFRNRSNIRRLSGFFTPRPFYKSRSTNEVSECIEATNASTQNKNKDEDIVKIQKAKSNWQDGANAHATRSLSEVHQKRMIENDRTWKQNTVDHKIGFSQQTVQNKYYRRRIY